MGRRLWRRAKDSDDAVALEVEAEIEGGTEPAAEPGAGSDAESFDELVARHLSPTPEPEVGRASPTVERAPDWLVDLRTQAVRWNSFWDRYDHATAEAKLAMVPPAPITAIVGPLPLAVPVTRRCRDQHWSGQSNVYVLTPEAEVPDEPDWTVVSRPSDLVSVVTDEANRFPMLVLDVPFDLPAFVRPLVERLRACGVGLVHYVLDGDPTDEDLATWYGELGQPAVLDLAGPVDPARVFELLHRGEPVVSVAGIPLTDHLLLALRLHAERSALVTSD